MIAYYRVSTQKQGQSGLGLEAQRAAVAEYMQGRGNLIGEFTEIESGTRNHRPQLQAALQACKDHKAPLIIAKLDRLSRNAAFLLNLRDSGVQIICADMPEANRLTLGLMAVIAEHEREQISDRTRQALQAAKKRGVKLGADRPEVAQANIERSKAADRFAENLRPILETMQGMTQREMAEELNARGIPTANNCQWQPTQLHRTLKRLKPLVS